MAKAPGIPRYTVETRPIRAGIKPFTYEALYSPDTLERIREAPRGRPRKQAGESRDGGQPDPERSAANLNKPQ